MAYIEEIAKDTKFIEIEDQLLVLIRRQVETELMLEEKFRDLCEEVYNFIKEIKGVVKEFEKKELVAAGNSNNLTNAMSVYIQRETNSDLQFSFGLSQLWDVLYIRVNELRLLSSELNVFGSPLEIQYVKSLKHLS
uniref:Uncharacterized protein n=1 Tax=Tanacetum cinerariifolium TaxID=118510 RepID=A0A699IHN4_TANCI|nr:hypothetical protein [Tanacetum cinerariifolium]